MLQDAKKNPDYNYVLFTNNSNDFSPEFCKDEFMEYSSSGFEIFNVIEGIETYLDERFNLKLELKKRNKEIEQEILALQGSITAEVGRYINEKRPDTFRALSASLHSLSADVFYDPSYQAVVPDYQTVVSASVADNIFRSASIAPSSSNRLVTTGEGNFDFVGLTISSISRVDDDSFVISAILTVATNKKTITWSKITNSCSYTIKFRYTRSSKSVSVFDAS